VRRAVALTVALTIPLLQTTAWALCSDGSTFPANGYVIGQTPVVNGANWSPHVFTGTRGSVFVPDLSTHENNGPTQPLTGGGHNWVFDQGSTLCKETDLGDPLNVATSWTIPPNTPTDCIVLPVIKGGRIVNIGDIPYQGEVITPTCDPTLLSGGGGSGNPANTYFNQLGCAISASKNGGLPVATTPHTATSYMFVAGIKGGLFSVALDNNSTSSGSDAGKTAGVQTYYSSIPEGQQLTNAAVSPDGRFAIATSIRRKPYIFACLNPLGDPGNPNGPLPDVNTFLSSQNPRNVHCMQVGNNAMQVNLTTAFGPDNQPYFGGQRVVNSFGSPPGGPSNFAWPNCIWQNNGSTSLADAFANGRANGCGNAVANFGFSSANIIQPQTLIRHIASNGDKYMYTGPVGGTVVQFKVTQDSSGFSRYTFRTYVTGLSITTGIGVADDLGSLMLYSDPSAIGAAGQEVVTKLPLCEDMP
jgi:hypothetical protein